MKHDAIPATILTVGHSTRTQDDLMELLRIHGVQVLMDVRKWLRSHRNPQFNREALEARLPHEGITYRHRPDLGGWRQAREDSPNTALRTPGFRGYADHMLTEEFQRALDELLKLARHQRLAIMCAELVPQRCHRSFIADALTARGAEVYHLLEKGRTQRHALRALARVGNGLVTYPTGETGQH